MSGGAGLERGYRRLLACYPHRFRDEHGEELLAVLLASAHGAQRRPGLRESADLIRSGLGMRLRPDVSRSARQGWSDALAAYSLAAPVLLLLTTVVMFLSRLATDQIRPAWPALCLTLAIEAVIIVPVMAGRRKTALAALSLAVLLLVADWAPGVALIVPWIMLTGLSVLLLEAVALIASPGPRHGRRVVHWGHWAFLLPAVAAAQIYPFIPLPGRGSLTALGGIVILILALNRLGRALRVSRSFRLLIAATFYPTAFGVATVSLPGFRFMNDPGPGSLALGCTLALLFAGPLLCAAVAIGTAIRPRRRRVI